MATTITVTKTVKITKEVRMSVYIITFEVDNEIRLDRMKNYLRSSCDGYCPIHRNAVAVNTLSSAKILRDNLIPYMTGADRVFVIRSGTESAWQNSYGQEHNDWLKKFL